MPASDFARPWPVARFDTTDSTNEEARRRAQAGDTGPGWLTAQRQTAGRGRLGREWDSPAGNLFATALFSTSWPLQKCALACFSAGLAVVDAAQAAGADADSLRLKWPNDVLAGDAKLAGILIETGSTAGVTWMAAGFGVNIADAPARADRATARLADLPGGGGISAARFLECIDAAFRARLSSLDADGFEPTRSAWLERAAHMGRIVEVSPAAGRIVGTMRGLDIDGALVVELANGDFHHVRAGEISVLG